MRGNTSVTHCIDNQWFLIRRGKQNWKGKKGGSFYALEKLPIIRSVSSSFSALPKCAGESHVTRSVDT